MSTNARSARRRRTGDSRPASELLSERIGALSPGERLPAEPRLAAELNISRPTLREALRSAEDEGLLVRKPGVGTVKTHRPQLINDLSVNTGVTDLIRRHGLDPGTKGLQVERRPAARDEARRLGLRRLARVWVVDRVRTAGGMPVIVSRDVLPERLLGEEEPSTAALAGSSLYAYLSDKGHEVHHGVASIHPVAADAALARRLEVRIGTLLLRLLQVDYDAEGEPVLLSDEHHLPDAFEFTVSRRGGVGEAE